MIDPTADFSPDPSRSAPQVPDLELIRQIGAGGFGQVWLARNRTTGHLRAVKVIPLHGAAGVDRAGREVTSISRLEANLCRQHPNLLTIHHVGKTEHCVFYVMDPADDIDGGPATADEAYRPATLSNQLAEGPLPPEDCLRYAHQLMAGLASLHEAGMVHRDVKPANCLLIGDQLKVADFGLLTHAGPQVSRVGTEKYMPPDGRMDARADVYAAGLVIYEMITGMPVERFPQLGARAKDVVANPDLCRLVRLVLRACQPDPQQRQTDARAMVGELVDAQRASGVAASAPHRWWLAGAASIVLIAGLSGIGYWFSRPPRVHVNFTTYPFEATVLIDGQQQTTLDGQPYTTPCTIEDLPARRHQVLFRLPGRSDLDAGQIDFGRSREIKAHWEGDGEE
jgi:serine/threonine protein kinase